MKAVYETPHVHFEMFTANQAITAGACDKGGYVKWDCMVGTSISVSNKVLSDNSADGTFTCTDNAGWFEGADTAKVTFNWSGHTNNNKDFSWSGSNQNGWTIKNLESALTGLLVFCTGMGSNTVYDSETNYSHWTKNGTTITHKTGDGYGCHHVHVGAVYGALSDVSTGSR